MTTKGYAVIYEDREWGETSIRGVFKNYNEALLNFQAEIGKELAFNILWNCEKNKDKAALLNTVPENVNEVSFFTGRSNHIEDLDAETLKQNFFETELEEFVFCIGDKIIITLKATTIYS